MTVLLLWSWMRAVAVTTVFTGVAVPTQHRQDTGHTTLSLDKLRKHVKARHEGLGCPVPPRFTALTTPIDCALSSSRSSGSCPMIPLQRPSRPLSLRGNSLGCHGQPEHLQIKHQVSATTITGKTLSSHCSMCNTW